MDNLDFGGFLKNIKIRVIDQNNNKKLNPVINA